MAKDVRITIGQFLTQRAKNADTYSDPYDPTRESVLSDPRVLPNPNLVFSKPAPLPPPPPVTLSTPAVLPPPPPVILGTPSMLPPPPPVTLSEPAVLPPPPPVSLSSPAVLPPPPAVVPSVPAVLPPPPAVTLSTPAVLPAPPPVVQTPPAVLPAPPPFSPQANAVLPPPPPVNLSQPAALPPPPSVTLSQRAQLPGPPNVVLSTPAVLPEPQEVKNPTFVPPDPKSVNPKANPNSGYVGVFPELYSPIIGAADPGSLSSDPILYERQLERETRSLPPGKAIAHAMTQVALFAQNLYGNIWNPAMVAPPPGTSDILLPALDIDRDPEGRKERQLGQVVIVDAALDGIPPDPSYRFQIMPGVARQGAQPTVTTIKKRDRLARAFGNLKSDGIEGAVNSLTTLSKVADPLFKNKQAFENGVIPMRLKGDNDFGFRTFKGAQGDMTNPDDVYVPLAFTDLRPIGDVYRSVYFRPIITSLSENFSPEWNEAAYFGRADSVVSYQGTGRTINLGFQLICFAPEDIRTIYQKLHWLQSMLYPEYDNNLSYRSGPVVRMRVGDVMNALGPEGARGLPGIIRNVDFDYTDSLWELKKDYKLPRKIDVSLTFTVLHDVPVGRGLEGRFGGLGTVDEKGIFSVKSGVATGTGENAPTVDRNVFRSFGRDKDVNYERLATADKERTGRG